MWFSRLKKNFQLSLGLGFRVGCPAFCCTVAVSFGAAFTLSFASIRNKLHQYSDTVALSAVPLTSRNTCANRRSNFENITKQHQHNKKSQILVLRVKRPIKVNSRWLLRHLGLGIFGSSTSKEPKFQPLFR